VSRYVFLVILFVSFVFITSKTVYNFLTVVNLQEFEMRIKVADYVGVDVNTTVITFGTTMPGTLASRNLTFANNLTFPVKVELSTFGQMATWVFPEKNYFILQPGETMSMAVIARVPANTPFGNYTGKMRIIFRKI
jgi:hypothetical protein